MRNFISALVWIIATISFSPTQASPQPLTKSTALSKAVAILKGDPYGRSISSVRENIKLAQLLPPGSSIGGACAGQKKSVWLFQVHVPPINGRDGHDEINGVLMIDASSGEMVCTSLGMLD